MPFHFNHASLSLILVISISSIMLAIFGGSDTIDFLDALTISGGLACLVRYGVHAIRGFRNKREKPEDRVVIGICGVAIYITFARILRQAAQEINVSVSDIYLSIPFTLLTATMLWATVLLAMAPPFRNHGSTITPKLALIISFAVGLSVYTIIKFIRYIV